MSWRRSQSGRPSDGSVDMAGALRLARLFSILFVATVGAVPQVAFPFNSQVPDIPRVNQPYSYRLSSSTFTPSAADFVYSLSDQPAWLQIDSATCTLSGTPGSGDVGPTTFTITAADSDGAASMDCTLVVSADPAPQLKGDIDQQLTQSANLSSADPAVVTLLPSTLFSFVFQQASFIDIVARRLYYYATLADGTPLPAWLTFTATGDTLVFTGTAPQLSAFPQSFNLSLIASDIEGFAGARAYFAIVIGMRQLAFFPSEQDVVVSTGKAVNITNLATGLFLNGMQLDLGEIANVSSALPSWLSIDTTTLVITGTPPDDEQSGQYTIQVMDKMGDMATLTLNLDSTGDALINGSIGTLTAYVGQDFDYIIPSSMVSDPDSTIQVSLPSDADWLSFSSSEHELHGHVPLTASPGMLQATLTVSLDNEVQTQNFVINVQAAVTTSSVSGSSHVSSSSVASSTATKSAHSSGEIGKSSGTDRNRLGGGTVAAIVISTLAGLALLIGACVFCHRRRKERGKSWVDFLHSTSGSRREISRPTIISDGDTVTVTTEFHTDVEKLAGSEMTGSSRPGSTMSRASKVPEMTETEPIRQVPVQLPRHSVRGSKWSSRLSRISQVSSIGDGGEEALRSSSNIPEWGQESDTINRTGHHSFSLPTEMARASLRTSQRASGKRPTGKRKARHRPQGSGAELSVPMEERQRSQRHPSRKGASSHHKKRSSLGLSATQDRSSLGTTTSTATRGTSVLSTKASDFPRPPSGSSFRLSGRFSMPRYSVVETEHGKSVRLVDRTGSVRDNRSLAEKRQSFIRNRASTTIESPLFSHGSRAPSVSKRSGQTSGSTSNYGTSTSSDYRSNKTDSHLRVHSESSSVLEPPARDARRLSTRAREAFAPNFPRAITENSMAGGGATDDWHTITDHESESSGFYTTDSDRRLSADDLTTQLALPRSQRSWVLPGEASPTPPPAPPGSRQSSASKHGHVPTAARERLKKRLNRDSRGQLCDYTTSSSPLSTSVLASSKEQRDFSSTYCRVPQPSTKARNRLSEPLSLVSTDSLRHSRASNARMRIVHATSARRPVSVDDVVRLSSLKAETEEDAVPGGENWENIEAEVRSRKSKERLAKSSSGPAFL